MATKHLIAIVGPTASGKTSLAVELAQQVNGEIICADSRTVYKGMDIGTAKPSIEERALVPHWGLDLVEPDEVFSVADFKQYADERIVDIQARGKVPFLVGGTGLYIDAVLYDFSFGPPVDQAERHTLEEMTIEQLTAYCMDNNVTLPENAKNKRYLIRAIERKSMSDIKKKALTPNVFIVGIATNMNTLRQRIEDRTEQLFEQDVAKEATMLGRKYGWDTEAMTGNIYPLLKLYLESEKTLEEIKEQFTTLDYQLAKRQMTWLRRNPDIIWATLTEARNYINRVFAPV